MPFALAAVALVAAQPQTPFRAGVNFVRVDVTPTDKSGAFIADLTQNDFEISELGKPQKIETFDKIVLDGGLMSRDHPPEIRNDDDERREAARADVRLFGIFLDDYHVSRVSSLQTRDILSRFIATDLGPSDLVELMTPTTPLSSAILTSNHESIESQLEHFLGRRGEYEPPQNAAEENAIRQYGNNPAMLETIRNQVALSALRGFIAHFSTHKDARKTLILVTEALGIGELDLQELYTDANRGNISIYWIDPLRLNALARGNGPEALRALTLYTDGRTLITNDLLPAMKQIVRDMSGYYLLGYNSTLDAYDGKFHEISVRVKRPGVSVRARKGYWAYTKNEVMAATAPPKPAVPADVGAALNVLAAAERVHSAVTGNFVVLRAASAAALRQLRGAPEPASNPAPVFRRVEHVLVRGRMASLDRQHVSAALLNPAGDHLLEIPIATVDARLECELPLAALAAGTYILDISDDADGAARALLAFRVEN